MAIDGFSFPKGFRYNSTFKQKATKPLKRSKLRRIGVGSLSATKRRIQAKLREIVILRDGGCILRLVLGNCSGPLQAEHLNSRVHAHTFGDTRNIVCLCQYHHIFWKPQNSRKYWELIEQHLGPTKWGWLKLAEANHTPHKMDWTAVELALEVELASLNTKSPKGDSVTSQKAL